MARARTYAAALLIAAGLVAAGHVQEQREGVSPQQPAARSRYVPQPPPRKPERSTSSGSGVRGMPTGNPINRRGWLGLDGTDYALRGREEDDHFSEESLDFVVFFNKASEKIMYWVGDIVGSAAYFDTIDEIRRLLGIDTYVGGWDRLSKEDAMQAADNVRYHNGDMSQGTITDTFE